MIKKYKNGFVTLKPNKDDYMRNGEVDENFYHDTMFMADLYINQLPDFDWYLVDYNKYLIYHLGSYLMQNPLKELMELLTSQGHLTLTPESPEESKRLLDQYFSTLNCDSWL